MSHEESNFDIKFCLRLWFKKKNGKKSLFGIKEKNLGQLTKNNFDQKVQKQSIFAEKLKPETRNRYFFHSFIHYFFITVWSGLRNIVNTCISINATERAIEWGYHCQITGGGGYLVERWVRGCAAQIGCFFGLSGLPMAPFLFENWFRYRSRFWKKHNFLMNFSFDLPIGCQKVLMCPNLHGKKCCLV